MSILLNASLCTTSSLQAGEKPGENDQEVLLDEASLKAASFPIEAMQNLDLTSDTLSSNKPNLSDVLHFMEQEPRAWHRDTRTKTREIATFVTATTGAALVAMVTSQIFMDNLLLDIAWNINDSQAQLGLAIPMAVFSIEPNRRLLTGLLNEVTSSSEAYKTCRQQLSWKYRVAQLVNLGFSFTMMGKSFVVAYRSTFLLGEGTSYDYIGIPLYMLTSFANTFNVMQEKISHFIPVSIDRTVGVLRSKMQERMVESYKKVHNLPVTEVIGFQKFLKLLESQHPEPSKLPWKMMLIVSYLDGLVESELVAHVNPAPTGFKVAKVIGSALGVIPIATYYLSGYLSAQEICRLFRTCEPQVEMNAQHMRNPGSVFYALSAALYGAYSGHIAGSWTGGKLYSYATGQDPNMWGHGHHLEYHSSSNTGLQALTTLITWVGSAMSVTPKSKLAAVQLWILFASDKWQNAAMGVGAVGYSFLPYKADIAPAYHALLENALHMTNKPGRGSLERVRDDMKKMVIGVHKSMGSMNEESVHILSQAMLDIRNAQEKMKEPTIDLKTLGVAPDEAVSTKCSGSNSEAGLEELLLGCDSHSTDAANILPATSAGERLKTWAMGKPVPENLAPKIAEISLPGWLDNAKKHAVWFKERFQRPETT